MLSRLKKISNANSSQYNIIDINWIIKASLLFLIVISQTSTIHANSFYVSTTATASGNGSFGNPWQLQTALNHPAALHPGDTVWIRGGVYTNTFDSQTSFSCRTNGTANAPIIFRNYNNERATIDGQLTYSLYVGLGNCSYTWFWGLEVTNSKSTDRNHDIYGSVTCTAENIKFINMIVHDTGSGLDCWKTAKNSETYGCIIYHIGNNLNNNGNLEGHGHGMYIQNDTIGTKIIHNNIVFSTYGYGVKIWQTTTTAPLGNFDIQKNIVFNGGSASENLGGVGNNSRTHNFFVVSNGPNNPVVNTVIKHNYTFAGTNTPRPPVNAFGLNYGVRNMILDSNYLACQTRLGFNNTPVFDASVNGNTILGGIPSVYGYYLWGFTQTDFPNNTYISEIPQTGLDYFLIPNKYEAGRGHLVIYNWDSLESVVVDISNLGLNPGDEFELVNVLDYFNDIVTETYQSNGILNVKMIGHSLCSSIGSNQVPVSQFPKFGVFVIRKKDKHVTTELEEVTKTQEVTIAPNPSTGKFRIHIEGNPSSMSIYNLLGKEILIIDNTTLPKELEIDLTDFTKGIYFLKLKYKNSFQSIKIIIQ